MGEYLSTPVKEKDSYDGENDTLKYGATGMQGWRKSMEDSHIAHLDVTDGVSIFGVFDGHGGKEVAQFVKNRFKDEIVKLDSFKKKDYKSALIDIFLKMDHLMTTEDGRKELSTYSKHASDKNPLNSKGVGDEDVAFYAGCTACVALITKEEIYVANAGDSRCVLAKKGMPIEMSLDHKPELETERKRIEKAGGYVEDGRINSVLNLSRSLGDLEYKVNHAMKQEDQIVSAYPDVKVEKRSADANFLIIACDGIWDCLSNQHAVEFVAERLGKMKHDKDFRLSKIVELMFDKILATDLTSSGGIGCDNMTCIIVAFK